MDIDKLEPKEIFDNLNKEQQEIFLDGFENCGHETWEGFLSECIKDYVVSNQWNIIY